jgi:hypothetical protein
MRKWSVAIAATLLITASSASAGEDEFVGFGGHVAVRTSSYGTRSYDVQTVFVGEPVEVVLTVRNNTRQTVEIGQAASDWLETVRVEFRRNDRPSSDFSLRRASPRVRHLATTLRGGQSSVETVVVTRPDNQPLEPGRYRLTVALPASSVNRMGKNDRLQDEVQFEVKTPATTDEQVDYYLHLAYQAMRRGDLDAEQLSIEQALQLHPQSAPAHADLGRLWRKRADCKRSRAELERAIAILNGGNDPGLQLSRISQEDWISGLQGLSASCGAR